MRSSDRGRSHLLADAVAGLSVALVLIPQALAYAELAGLPAHYGLIAAALPAVAAAFFVSSPQLQTGPTALTSILTFGILSPLFVPYSLSYVHAAALLALIVGLTRLAIGLLKLGNIAYFMSQPVLRGFTSAAAVLIILSQLPTALGVRAGDGHIVVAVARTLAHPGEWDPLAIALSAVTLLLVLGGRQLSPLFPGVLVAVALGIVVSTLFDYAGPVIGTFPVALPTPALDLPWGALPSLLLGGVTIAVVKFAEATSIARTFAAEDRSSWDPNREFISQGVANLTSGLFGGFPVGGSFSRSSLARLAGARSRWSGLFAGALVLAFLPLAGLLALLPKAVLGAVVIGAVVNLLKFRELARLWRYARLQALTAYATFALTLALSPRIDVAVLLGIGAAIAAHLYREGQLGVKAKRDGATLTLVLNGVLWFGATHVLEDAAREALADDAGLERIVIDGEALGRVDLSGALLLDDLVERARERGVELEVRGLKPYMERVLKRVRRSS